MVSSWVLNKFHPTDKKYVDLAYDKFMSVLDMIFNNDFSEAQKSLHTK
jgi:peptidyl-tRNA hydrolase